jgi:AraC-like DNA-binding protein
LTAALAGNRSAEPLQQHRQLAERIKQALLDSIDSPVTLDHLAASFGCRKETLIRVFRRAFHITR